MRTDQLVVLGAVGLAAWWWWTHRQTAAPLLPNYAAPVGLWTGPASLPRPVASVGTSIVYQDPLTGEWIEVPI